MIDLIPVQAAPRIAAMLAAHESRMLEFKRNRQLREISGLDTLEASRLLCIWLAQGLRLLCQPLPATGPLCQARARSGGKFIIKRP